MQRCELPFAFQKKRERKVPALHRKQGLRRQEKAIVTMKVLSLTVLLKEVYLQSGIMACAGSMARTAGDVILLDSIIRNNDFNSTGNGAVATAVPCAADVNTSLDLQGVRLGLPSTLGWVPSATYDGISGEVSITPDSYGLQIPSIHPSILLILHSKSCHSLCWDTSHSSTGTVSLAVTSIHSVQAALLKSA